MTAAVFMAGLAHGLKHLAMPTLLVIVVDDDRGPYGGR